MKSNSGKRLQELDAMRGIAALMVVFFHFTVDREQAQQGFKLGITGVDLFFIISGFVIFLTISNTKHWKDFVISRVSRLYPAYWTAVLLTTISISLSNYFAGQSSHGLLFDCLGNLTMFNYYLKIPNLDGSYWTLIIEMQFYIVILLIFRLKWLDKIVTLGCIGLAFVLANHFIISHISPYLFKVSRGAYQFINHLPLFFSGILFYKIKFQGRNPALLLLVVLCYTSQIVMFYDGGKAMLYITRGEYFPFLTAYFIIFTLYAFNVKLPIVNRFTIYLGTISYSLYLVHQHIGAVVIIPLMMKYAHLSFWQSALFVALPAVFLLATAITYLIEKPAMQYIRGLYKGSKQKRLAVS
ncbi:MAG: acyltransferase [Lewinellaceae bacterium]|nr:acyltransferase [Saprospiraceae bacterium]MCB9354958.1 acyltransferase [Lewinellaceae bacterium]